MHSGTIPSAGATDQGWGGAGRFRDAATASWRQSESPGAKRRGSLSSKEARDGRDWHLVFPRAWLRPAVVAVVQADTRSGHRRERRTRRLMLSVDIRATEVCETCSDHGTSANVGVPSQVDSEGDILFHHGSINFFA
jgi:hypothetical protein